MRAIIVLTLSLLTVGCGQNEHAHDGMSAAMDAMVMQMADAGTHDAGADGGPAVGSSCTSSDECPSGGSGSPACLTDWPGGYCVVDECTQHGHDCPNDPGQGSTASTGSKCVVAPTARCLALCAGKLDCRAGYACLPKQDSSGHGTANVCVPE